MERTPLPWFGRGFTSNPILYEKIKQKYGYGRQRRTKINKNLIQEYDMRIR